MLGIFEVNIEYLQVCQAKIKGGRFFMIKFFKPRVHPPKNSLRTQGTTYRNLKQKLCP